MPYIEKSRRDAFHHKLVCMSTPGDLNYLCTLAILEREKDRSIDLTHVIYNLGLEYLELKGECYATYNDIIGAFTSCGLEYDRRSKLRRLRISEPIKELTARFYKNMVAPYEDKKIKENGDVYI